MASGGGRARIPEMVEVLQQPANSLARWSPSVGNETLALLERIPIESRETVRDEAISILSRCVPPTQLQGQDTGLVVGYVQSGKTMSFTTVSALAHDNGYQIIIIITGTSVSLFKQSTERLKNDLRLPDRIRGWKLFTNPALNTTASRSIESALQRWKDGNVSPAERQTVLITVMKHHGRLGKLIALLSQLDLHGVPILVIDDEADQAGLNNLVREGDESTTYRRLVHLRARLPQHTFLQYTATPQAPLLINLIDILSPRFAEVLTPGPMYTGGATFFEQNLQLVREISEAQVPTKDNVLNEPPESLLEAMRIFFLGVAAGMVLGPYPYNRSMMVHPSHRTTQHEDYFLWVDQVMARWQRTLAEPEDDPDREELIDEFQDAYDDLARTAQDLPAFAALVEKLPRAIRETVPIRVNAMRGPTPEVEWSQDYSHILIGGTALDRGYTVEGLTITYMPRGRGVGNADTIQQRARWFGYKAEYLGYCRVYLAQETFRAYRSYVEHEEDVRQRLRQHRVTGRPLREWRRAFFLDRTLRPTRDCVLNLDYMHGNYSNKWYEPRAPHDSTEALKENRTIVQQFVSGLNLIPNEGDARRLEAHKHLVDSNVPLRRAYEHLLTRLHLTRPSDSTRSFGLLMQIQDHLTRHPNDMCTVYLMRPGVTEPSHRRVNAKDEISNLFQGGYPVPQSNIYPGDRHIRSQQGLTIQIHHIDEVRQYTNNSRDRVIAKDIPVVAVWVPREMSADWISQDQGGPE